MTHNIILRVGFGLNVTFLLMMFALPIEALRLVSSVFMTSLALMAASLWVPDTWQQIKLGRIDTERVTLIAVGITTLFIAALGSYTMFFNLIGRPPWLSALPISPYIQLNLAFAMFLLTADPVKPQPSFQTWNVWIIAGLVVLAMSIGFLLGLGVDTTDSIVDQFRYW